MSEILSFLATLWISPMRDDLAALLWCLWLGVVLATVYAYLRRMTLGRAITALRDGGAVSPETAMTPADLKLDRLAARALQSRDRLIRKEGEGYYLPEETDKKARAVIRVGPSAWWVIPLVALGAYAALVAAWYIIPLF
ncbi:MAG: hypothetical protein J6Z79_00590 [Clostridia bacterium]|nr:hypothetical protein [Clostridia bacterium]